MRTLTSTTEGTTNVVVSSSIPGYLEILVVVSPIQLHFPMVISQVEILLLEVPTLDVASSLLLLKLFFMHHLTIL